MIQVELMTQETFVLRRHILEADANDAVLLCHYLRTHRCQGFAFETVIVSYDVCTSLGISRPHEVKTPPMQSIIAHVITFFLLMMFYFSSC